MSFSPDDDYMKKYTPSGQFRPLSYNGLKKIQPRKSRVANPGQDKNLA